MSTIGNREHVGLVDRLPAADRRAVEAEAVFEDAFVEVVDRVGAVLPGAEHVARTSGRPARPCCPCNTKRSSWDPWENSSIYSPHSSVLDEGCMPTESRRNIRSGRWLPATRLTCFHTGADDERNRLGLGSIQVSVSVLSCLRASLRGQAPCLASSQRCLKKLHLFYSHIRDLVPIPSFDGNMTRIVQFACLSSCHSIPSAGQLPRTGGIYHHLSRATVSERRAGTRLQATGNCSSADFGAFRHLLI